MFSRRLMFCRTSGGRIRHVLLVGLDQADVLSSISKPSPVAKEPVTSHPKLSKKRGVSQYWHFIPKCTFNRKAVLLYQCINIIWELRIYFSRICTVSFIYNKTTHLFIFIKKNSHLVQANMVGPRGAETYGKASVRLRCASEVSLCTCQSKLPFCAIFGLRDAWGVVGAGSHCYNCRLFSHWIMRKLTPVFSCRSSVEGHRPDAPRSRTGRVCLSCSCEIK